ncbi:hypothetical protein CONPUDRAFT_147901 [Coniophora puteana RWD-64-598 SS2]|uniref:Uncharacterized protein n=1 Tax=Coniophora puteana (strain RWD-64-598) TaxID=741705 RepID=R7SGA5_CONPW|nr:uncharacterized protein CONPUDRAFT_147901 [Coniophora puteana RWD-64-598 SS2]EIW74124.1 hypothetical protein CONPUDRAFT_147901 [Coniophora puteana RWD-64-598 SS2]
MAMANGSSTLLNEPIHPGGMPVDRGCSKIATIRRVSANYQTSHGTQLIRGVLGLPSPHDSPSSPAPILPDFAIPVNHLSQCSPVPTSQPLDDYPNCCSQMSHGTQLTHGAPHTSSLPGLSSPIPTPSLPTFATSVDSLSHSSPVPTSQPLDDYSNHWSQMSHGAQLSHEPSHTSSSPGLSSSPASIQLVASMRADLVHSDEADVLHAHDPNPFLISSPASRAQYIFIHEDPSEEQTDDAMAGEVEETDDVAIDGATAKYAFNPAIQALELDLGAFNDSMVAVNAAMSQVLAFVVAQRQHIITLAVDSPEAMSLLDPFSKSLATVVDIWNQAIDARVSASYSARSTQNRFASATQPSPSAPLGKHIFGSKGFSCPSKPVSFVDAVKTSSKMEAPLIPVPASQPGFPNEPLTEVVGPASIAACLPNTKAKTERPPSATKNVTITIKDLSSFFATRVPCDEELINMFLDFSAHLPGTPFHDLICITWSSPCAFRFTFKSYVNDNMVHICEEFISVLPCWTDQVLLPFLTENMSDFGHDDSAPS